MMVWKVQLNCLKNNCLNMYKLTFIISLFYFLSACTNEMQKPKSDRYTAKQFKDSLVAINKTLMESEDRLIEKFIERKQWPVVSTGTGLRYIIYEKGKGQNLAQIGQYASISYIISLLNGKVCYQSKLGEKKSFTVEADDVESGLHEGIKYMKVGDRAKLIIPSYLAHGLIGDMDKIPPKSTIIYDLKLISLK